LTWIVLVSVIGGIIFGYFVVPDETIKQMDTIITWALAFLLFMIGIDLGRNKGVIIKIKSQGIKILLIPISIALGSILGASFAGIILGMPFNESSAVGAGFGWYSLSSIILTQMYNAEIGTLAFLTNVFRELFAFIVIPLIARYIGKYEAIAPGGATTMDTTLPLIAKSVGGEVVVMAFISGATLSMLVPVLVPLLIKLPF